MTNHPAVGELFAALEHHELSGWVREHLEQCVACRVRVARLEQAGPSQPPSANVVQRIIEASALVPGVLRSPQDTEGINPAPGELWRVGRSEALLAWVRKDFRDDAFEVIPVVLDIELADEQTIILPSTSSHLTVELALMTALRTHVHRNAFLDRIGQLDVSEQVEEVLASSREGRSTMVTVGRRIDHDDDVRIEYRQALRDLLADLTPSAWTASGPDDSEKPAPEASGSIVPMLPGEEAIRNEIPIRLASAKCLPLDRNRIPIAGQQELEVLFKVAYLDTAVIVASVDSLRSAESSVFEFAAACQRAGESSPDTDAVCVVEPSSDWPCLLFSRASMRNAVELPSGADAGPAPIISGLGLVDTLWKHLDGSEPAWEVVESAPHGAGPANISALAERHAQDSIASIQAQGRRAQQIAKKSTWSALDPSLAGNVSRFLESVAQSVPVEVAIAELQREASVD